MISNINFEKYQKIATFLNENEDLCAKDLLMLYLEKFSQYPNDKYEIKYISSNNRIYKVNIYEVK